MRRHIFGLVFLGLIALPSAAQVPGMFQPLLLAPYVFATWDAATLTGSGSLSGGSLTFNSNSTASVVRSTKFAASKFYAEITITTLTSGTGNFGVGTVDSTQATVTPTSISTVPAKFWEDRNDGLKINNASSAGYGSNYGAGAVMSIAVDNTLGSGSGKVWVGSCSGGTITWPASGNPATGANPMYSNLTGNIGLLLNNFNTSAAVVTLNAGASAYACTPPSGFGNL